MKATIRPAPSNTSSNTTTSLVNKDLENWVILHGNSEVVVEDVWGIGREIGIKYKGDKMNRFNVLSKDGRRELRVVVGRNTMKGEVEGSWVGADGC